MKRLAAACCVAAALAAEASDEAARALERGLPSMALALYAERAEPPPAEIKAAALLDAGDAAGAWQALENAPDSLLRAGAAAAVGRHAEALEIAARLAATDRSGQAGRLQARALAALGRTAEAGGILAALAASGLAGADYAAFLIDAGDPSGALRELDRLPPVENDAGPDILVARAALAVGDAQAAIARLDKVQSPGPTLGMAALELRIEALTSLGRRIEAEEAAERFIEAHPRHPQIERAFDLLDRLYAGQPSPSSGELRRWADDATMPRRRAFALWHLGRNERRLQRADSATAAYRAFLATGQDPAAQDAARSELAALLLEQGLAEESHRVAAAGDGPRARFGAAVALASLGEFATAAEAFAASYAQTGWEAARANAALCSAVAHGRPPLDATDAALETAAAITLAARRDASAPGALEAAAAASDAARLGVAEWHFLAGDRLAARQALQRVSSTDPAAAERAAALEVFTADDGTADGDAAVLAAAERYHARFAAGTLAAEVAFKEGEVHFRRGDYASARQRFEAAAATPGSPLGERARFLAAMSAARSMDAAAREDAIELYGEIARGSGPLSARARLEQALLLNVSGRPAEALAVLDALAEDPDPNIRYAAFIEKGDTHFASPNATPEALREAIAAWRLAAVEDAPPRWRNHACAKIGAAHERLGETPSALASYYRALETRPGEEPETFWSMKAGFDAARILETDSKLDEAIAIYEILAARGGPRADEASQRLNRLRLENFLWDEQPAATPKQP